MVATEVALTEFADPYSSVDENAKRLRGCLKTAGLELSAMRLWPQLRQEHTFTTGNADSGIYQLPADFRCMVDQTGWDRASQWPMEGPLSAQEWHTVIAQQNNVVMTAYFREAESELWLWPRPPPAGAEIAFEYASRYWVSSDGASIPDKLFPTVATDRVLLDPLLVARALKYHFLGEMGLDITKARADYEQAFQMVASQDMAPILTLYRLEKPPTAVYSVQIDIP